MSKIVIYSGNDKIGEIDATPTTFLKFMLTDTTRGDRGYYLKVNYPYDATKGKKDYAKPSGMQLQGDK